MDNNIYKRYLNMAIEFICQEVNCNEEDLEFRIIISDNYNLDINKYQFNNNQVIDSNGIFIPTYFQNTEVKEAGLNIIVINREKLNSSLPVFITSVIIHEINHYNDDRIYYKEFSEKYGVIFGKNYERGSLEDVLGGYYQMRSEMRSKYLQEKFNCTYKINLLDQTIEKHNKGIQSVIADENDHYNMAHVMGQIKCWEDLLTEHKEDQIYKSITLSKQRFTKLYPFCKELLDLYEEESFYEHCNKVKSELENNKKRY